MRIVHAVETLSREAGGLPVAVTGLAAALADLGRAGIQSEIVTAESPHPITVAATVPVHPVTSPSTWLEESGRRSPLSILHQHGIWARLPVSAGRFAKRRRIPLILSPHGMLEPWALAHHAWRKRIAMMAYQRRNLESAEVLHATSRAEAEQLRLLGLRQPIAEIPLGVDPIPAKPLDPGAVSMPKQKKQALFLSRIHPKKGIEMLLDAWARIDAPDWELIIAGNDDGGHQPPLERRAKKLSLGDRVRFVGPVFGGEKDTLFRRADLFVLPSFSENFGIVVPEAMLYGLPVITTRSTPWEVVEREACGWWIDASPEVLVEALETASALPDRDLAAMGQRGREVVERVHGWATIAVGYLEVYRWMIGEGGRPDCVPAPVSA